MALDTMLRLLAPSGGLSEADPAAAIPPIAAATRRAWRAQNVNWPSAAHRFSRHSGHCPDALFFKLASHQAPAPARSRAESELLTAYRSSTQASNAR